MDLYLGHDRAMLGNLWYMISVLPNLRLLDLEVPWDYNFDGPKENLVWKPEFQGLKTIVVKEEQTKSKLFSKLQTLRFIAFFDTYHDEAPIEVYTQAKYPSIPFSDNFIDFLRFSPSLEDVTIKGKFRIFKINKSLPTIHVGVYCDHRNPTKEKFVLDAIRNNERLPIHSLIFANFNIDYRVPIPKEILLIKPRLIEMNFREDTWNILRKEKEDLTRVVMPKIMKKSDKSDELLLELIKKQRNIIILDLVLSFNNKTIKLGLL
ncbi:MAG: hypothetical protein GY714_24780, partial [Desulfobacterales bacterium]|nr:hypothetical protein [Desulfobacterales bacterium]